MLVAPPPPTANIAIIHIPQIFRQIDAEFDVRVVVVYVMPVRNIGTLGLVAVQIKYPYCPKIT